MKTRRYTINQFRKEFPSDDACLDHILALRLAKIPCCPQCSQQTTFKRIAGKRSYQCSDKDCQYQLYPTAGTVFEKSTTSLSSWFYAMYLMISTRNGVSAKEIERQLGVTYKTAWRMDHQIRKMMKSGQGLLSGIVEADKMYIGGKTANKHKAERDRRNSMGTGAYHQKPLLALVQRNGEVRTQVIEKTVGSVVKPIIVSLVSPDAQLITDGQGAYAGLKREIVNHEQGEFARGIFHTNTVEGFFSHLRRTISGTHIQVSPKYLQAYANECALYSFRHLSQQMFHHLLQQVV